MRPDKNNSALGSSTVRAADGGAAKRVADPTVPAGINAAVAETAPPDDFGPWFAGQSGRLPTDFELDL
jgi:hypothetical protein